MASTSKKWLDLCFMAVLLIHIQKGDTSHNDHSRRSVSLHTVESLLDNQNLHTVESLTNKRQRRSVLHTVESLSDRRRPHSLHTVESLLDNDRQQRDLLSHHTVESLNEKHHNQRGPHSLHTVESLLDNDRHQRDLLSRHTVESLSDQRRPHSLHTVESLLDNDRHQRTSLGRHTVESLLHRDGENSRTLESVESHHRQNVEHYNYNQQIHHNKHYKDSNNRHKRPQSLYEKLEPYISPKNLVLLKELLGDENRKSQSRHLTNRHDNRHKYRNYDYRQYSLELVRQQLNRNRQSLKQLNSVDHPLLRYRTDNRDRRHDYRDRRQDNRDRRLEDRDRRQRGRYRHDSSRYQSRYDKNQRHQDKTDRYNHKYVDEPDKRYRESNNRGSYQSVQHRDRYDYRGSSHDQNRRPRRDRKKSYNNLRARLEELDQRDSSKGDKKTQGSLRTIKERLGKDLFHLDSSPVKSLLRAANDLDCAAQIKCIQQCLEKPKKDECSNTCEEEIQCDPPEDDDQDLCDQSGHDSCEGQLGTGSTKGQLLEMENNECC